MVIDRGVQVDVPGAGATLGPSGGLVLGRAAAVDPPAAAVGDPADLLHIHVHHVTGTGPFVAEDRFAQVLTRHVEVTQPGDTVANEDPPDRGGGQVDALLGELADQLHGTDLVLTAQRDHPLLHIGVGLVR